MRHLSAVFLLAVVIVLTGCPGDDGVVREDEGWLARGETTVRDTTQRAVRLGERPLTIDIADGSITVIGADVDEAHIVFERVARGGSTSAAERRLDRVTIDETGDEARYEFRVERQRQTNVHATATVPNSADLVIRLENGRVRLSDLSGTVDVRGRAGSIDGEALRTQSLNSRIEQGQQRIAFAEVPDRGEIRLRTSVGPVELTLPPDAPLQVSAETSTGAIAVEGMEATRERFEDRQAWTRYRGRFGAGTGTLVVQVDVGNIRIGGAPTAGAE